MAKFVEFSAREILDSRGTPTVHVTCVLDDGSTGAASVPSGQSTGASEALELRDGDRARYGGKGCRTAVANVKDQINTTFAGTVATTQAELDKTLIELDGTRDKSNLGANATLGTSLAFARAMAQSQGVPLYQYFARLIDASPTRLPRLTINLFSGGHHGGGQVSIQDLLIVPTSPVSIDGSLVMMHAIYQAALERMQRQYQMRWLTADEGGLAPPLSNSEAMIEAGMQAIRDAGFEPGSDAHLALDVASSHFFGDDRYVLDGRELNGDQVIAQLARWQQDYPLVSIEDGLAEEDWAHWPALTQRLGELLVLGDDLLCTNPSRIQHAINTKACNALLLKVNQVGTLTEAADAYQLARQAGWAVTLSVRSGETEDDWAADLAVGWDADQFKNGSITQSERLAKYNRLLAIEDATGFPLKA
jgi:enolase